MRLFHTALIHARACRAAVGKTHPQTYLASIYRNSPNCSFFAFNAWQATMRKTQRRGNSGEFSRFEGLQSIETAARKKTASALPKGKTEAAAFNARARPLAALGSHSCVALSSAN